MFRTRTCMRAVPRARMRSRLVRVARATARIACACDIHHFATVLSYPRCELRAMRAYTRAQHDRVHDREAGKTERNNEPNVNGAPNVNFMRARNVEMLDVPL